MEIIGFLIFLFLGVTCAPPRCEEVTVDTEEMRGQCCLQFKNGKPSDIQQTIQRAYQTNKMTMTHIMYPGTDELRFRNPHDNTNRRKMIDDVDSRRENSNENNRPRFYEERGENRHTIDDTDHRNREHQNANNDRPKFYEQRGDGRNTNNDNNRRKIWEDSDGNREKQNGNTHNKQKGESVSNEKQNRNETKVKTKIETNDARGVTKDEKNSNVTIGNRNNVDVPESCPSGERMDHNGECQEIFE